MQAKGRRYYGSSAIVVFGVVLAAVCSCRADSGWNLSKDLDTALRVGSWPEERLPGGVVWCVAARVVDANRGIVVELCRHEAGSPVTMQVRRLSTGIPGIEEWLHGKGEAPKVTVQKQHSVDMKQLTRLADEYEHLKMNASLPGAMVLHGTHLTIAGVDWVRNWYRREWWSSGPGVRTETEVEKWIAELVKLAESAA